MSTIDPLCIHYHRDFDGMVSAAILATILRAQHADVATWKSVNYDQRTDWPSFEADKRFAIVDFHFHPRAEYWFDHHPTTFLTPELRAQYRPSDRWQWDEKSPSCPPLILRHASQHWSYAPEDRFVEMARWSDIVDAARYTSVDQAVFGEEPALRIARALTVSPNSDWIDVLVGAMAESTLEAVAAREDVEKAHQRASRNRDRALEQFPPTVAWRKDGVLLFDASSDKIRRERFAAFYHYPEIHYSVGVIPTRSGYHVSAGENPWNPLPKEAPGAHIGEIMETYGGGGHRAVGGANPESLEAARRVAAEVAEKLRRATVAR
jgi:oligoribonuclease NrnB/cAMP/cGMP phosphodiesterase (DHH superfamily)